MGENLREMESPIAEHPSFYVDTLFVYAFKDPHDYDVMFAADKDHYRLFSRLEKAV
jgi:hypothetical protein